MSNSARGRRRDPNYRIGPGIPFAWKVSGLAILAIAAVVAVFIAVTA